MFTDTFTWIEKIHWTAQAISAAATIALACLTFVLAVGTVFLWWATRQLVRNGKRTAEQQLRAYVGITSGHVALETIDGTIKPRATIRIENFGQTPAYEVSVFSAIENATKFSEVCDNGTLIPGKITIFPKSSVRIIFSGNYGVPDGTAPVGTFVFGHITYNDAFGYSKRTNFRFTARELTLGGRSTDLCSCDDGKDAN